MSPADGQQASLDLWPLSVIERYVESQKDR